MAKRTLYLIDGHSQIYRAYYAPFRNLTSPFGEPTRATYVFCQMLLNLLKNRKPDYLAMVMDVSDETVFRVEIASDYKANRSPPPEDLPVQKERILKIVAAMGIPILGKPGFEADDLMATLCERHCRSDLDIYLVSNDKDLDQVLCESVRLYNPGKDEVIDVAAMVAAKGYGPDKAVEAQMLMGDTVDNVRGVVGVGPKKAAELLAKYGSVAGIIENADKLTPKLKENVLSFAQRAEQVRTLVTLRRDVPFEFALESAATSRLKRDPARGMFVELDFHRLTDQLDAFFRNREGEATNREGEARAEPIERAEEAEALDREDETSDSDDREGEAPAEPAAEAPAPDDATPPWEGEARDGDTPREGEAPAEPLSPQFSVPSPAITDGPSAARARMARGDYRLVDDLPRLTALARQLAGVDEFVFDTETTGLCPVDAALVGLSFAWEAGKACYVPVRGVGTTVSIDAVREHLGPIFANEKIGKCGQNMKYDIGVLLAACIPVRGIRFDTMLASFVLDATRRSHGIDALSLELLALRKIATVDLIGRGKDERRFDQLKTEDVCAYACEDADAAWRLMELFKPQLGDSPLGRLLRDVEMPLVEVLAWMEHYGVAVDTDLLARISNEMAERMKQLTQEIHRALGRPFNIDSTRQLGEVLFDELKLPVIKRTQTTRSTDAEVLRELVLRTNHPVPRLVLEYRELAKLKGTYIDTLPDMISSRTGRIHCGFHQAAAVTGRLASSDPNLQNIPIRTDTGAQVRRAFVPRPLALCDGAIDEPVAVAVPRERNGNAGMLPGLFDSCESPPMRRAVPELAADPSLVLLTADYSQIELRILAHFCQDANLMQAFHDDVDVHAFVASQVFGVPIDQVTKEQRGRAKTVNFGIIYGQSPFGLSRQTGMSVSEARRFIETYFNRYPKIRGFLDQCIAQARRTGYVETMLGRRRRIADINSRNPQARTQAERFAVNSVVQGTAADIIKKAMINIHRRIRDEGRAMRMLIQVHDELVFEIPRRTLQDDARMVRDEMSGAVPLSVPVKVDIAAGENWLDVEEVRV